MTTDHPNLPDEDLVAYLDGELESDRVAEVEQLLRDRPAIRERLAEFQNTWDLLDTLPRAEATHSFTRSTIEMVVGDARKELQKNRKGIPVWVYYSLAAAVTLLVGGSIGFAVFDHYQKQPLRELVAEIDIIQDFEKYLILEDVSFLKKLDEEGDLFVIDDELELGIENRDKIKGDKINPGTAEGDKIGEEKISGNWEAFESNSSRGRKSQTKVSVDGRSYSFREGMEYIQALDDKEFLDFKRKQQRYSELSESQKAHVRKIHSDLKSEPNELLLRGILDRYYDWIKTIKSSIRADLLELELDKRIETIRFLQTQQQQQTYGIEDNFQIPNVDDTSVVYKWLIETINLGMRDEKGEKAAKRRTVRSRTQLLENILADEIVARELFFTDERISNLYERLSLESQLIIREMPTLDAQIELIIQWSRAVAAWRVTSAQREAAYGKLNEDEKAKVDEMSIESRRRFLDRYFIRLKRRPNIP